ncbi:MAG: sporulation protein YunB [Paenibacillus sp. RIFOXYA1_FULL_44_5]|nr:MAG: sporulation protein YunB [Paenibacillus sp. RIFOXYA1_FULL_44_5]
MAKRRWRSSRPGKSGMKKTIFIVMLIFFLLTLQSFIFVEKNLQQPLMGIAKVRVEQIATQAINKTISDKLSQGTNFDKLIDWKTDNSGKVTGFMLNYAEHMKITSDTVSTVQSLLMNLKSMTEHVPLGMAFGSNILASFGPKIPIKLVPAGAVKVDLNTRQQNAGINMLLVEVYIHIIAEVAIIIPFDTAPDVVETEIPISYVLVVGDTPQYYFDNNGNPIGNSQALPPSISLPNSGGLSNSSSFGGTSIKGSTPTK